MPAADSEVTAVIVAYQRSVVSLRSRVVSYLERNWVGLGSWRDSDIATFLETILPMVDAGQTQVAAMTDAYLATMATIVLGEPPALVGIDPGIVTVQALRGVPAPDVYRRPAVQLYTALRDGKPLDEAVELGRQRLIDISTTDQQLAKTTATRHALERDDRVAGYRRSLTGTKSCALCIVASTQRYKREQLMGIHPGCDCGVIPIYGDVDPGHVIDPDTLENVHDRITERFGVHSDDARNPIDYRHVLVEHHHGEIGPVLAVRDHDFTGPSDL